MFTDKYFFEQVAMAQNFYILLEVVEKKTSFF